MEIKRFEEMNISEDIKKAIKAMGFEEATPIQAKSIPVIMEGKDFIGIAQTGTGKTCAFGIPAIEKIDFDSDKLQTLILCPTRELVMQTSDELKNLASNNKDVKIVPIYGGQQIDRQISSLKKKPQIVVGTPGRVMDHMRRKTIKMDNIKLLVLDEADEMLNMGFREDLDVILETADTSRQTVLFSATMSRDILNITKKYQKEDAEKVEISHKTLTAPKISQYMLRVKNDKKQDALTRILDLEDFKLAIIFCNTKRKVDEIVENLRFRGYLIEAIHGDMKQSQRDNVMKKFKSGKLNILVATDVAARGIDIEDVEVVINFDIPSDEEYYVHRIGRTGRAGREGKAISFATPKEMYKLRDIQKYTNAEMKEYELPSSETVNNKKYAKLFSDVTNIITENELVEETKLVEKFLEDNEISMIDLIAGLVKYNLKDSMLDFKELTFNEKDISKKDKSDVGPDRKRLFLTVGKLDGANRNNLRDFIVEKTGIDRSFIHDAEVLDKFSFLTVSSLESKKIIDKLNGEKYGERKIAIEESTKEPKTKKYDSPKRGNFGRGDRSGKGNFSKDNRGNFSRRNRSSIGKRGN